MLALCLATAACSDAARDAASGEPSVSFYLDFGGTPDAATLTPRVAATVDGSMFAVAPSDRPSAILIFDEDGRFQEAIGRRGSGPGELGSVAALAFDPADSLWVFADNRVDVWSPELEFVRSMPLGVRSLDVAIGGDPRGPFIGGTTPGFMNQRGLGTWRFDASGSLEPFELAVGIGVTSSMDGRLVAVDRGGVWIANAYEWNVRRLNPEGDTLRQTVDLPAWWQTIEDPQFADLMDTSPVVLDIGLDRDGNLLVLAGLPIANREALEFVLSGGGEPLPTWFVDHVLGVYHPDSLAPRSERRYDYLPLNFLNQDLAAAAIMNGDSVVIPVYRIQDLR